jgi:hypothetical protein
MVSRLAHAWKTDGYLTAPQLLRFVILGTTLVKDRVVESEQCECYWREFDKA